MFAQACPGSRRRSLLRQVALQQHPALIGVQVHRPKCGANPLVAPLGQGGLAPVKPRM
jgi:hypothetical protein